MIYAFPAGATDRFGSLATPIVTDLAVADAWWRREDPTRTLRFDLAAFPGCASTLGRLDLARVPLQRGPEFYAPFGRSTFRLTVRRTGAGRVTSRPAGISCGMRCSASFRAGAAVRLRAAPVAGGRFAGWSDACRGGGACVVTASADRAVRATFRR